MNLLNIFQNILIIKIFIKYIYTLPFTKEFIIYLLEECKKLDNKK